MLPGDSYGEVLANRSFRLLWFGQTLSRLGQSIIYVAVALWVYDLTGSAREVSLAVALELLPWAVVGPLAGVLADHMDRKAMLLAGYVIQAGLVALLPFTRNLGQVYVLVFLISLLAPVTRIVWSAALPAITGQELFVRGSSLDIVAFNAANVAGPILGGWLVNMVGARPTFMVVVGCLLGAACLSVWAAVPGPAVKRSETLGIRSIGSDLWEGARFLAGNQILRYLVLLNCIASFGWSAPNVAAVAYLTDTLGLGGREYGLLQGTMSLSMAVGVYLLGRYFRLLSRQLLVVGGAVVAGLAYTVALIEPELAHLLGLWFISGLAWATLWLTHEALFAELTPDRVRGRVYSLADAVIYMAEVGTALLGGWMVSVWGPAEAFFAIGLSVALGSIVLSAISGGYRAIAELGRSHTGLA